MGLSTTKLTTSRAANCIVSHKALTPNTLQKAVFRNAKDRRLACDLRHFTTPFAVKRKSATKIPNVARASTSL